MKFALLSDLVVVSVYDFHPGVLPGFEVVQIPDGCVVSNGMIYLDGSFHQGSYTDFLIQKQIEDPLVLMQKAMMVDFISQFTLNTPK